MRKKAKRTYRKPAERKRLLKEIRMLTKHGTPVYRALRMSKVNPSTYYKWMGEARG
jgi:adenine deaminase